MTYMRETDSYLPIVNSCLLHSFKRKQTVRTTSRLVLVYRKMVLSSIVFVILAIIVGVWYFIQRHLSFFERHGIPGLPVSMPAGNLQGVGSKMHFCELMQKYYMENKHRGLFLGLYFFLMRVVLVTDLDLVRNILIKDAHLFKGRSIYYNEADDPLSAHLFALSGSKWKQLRVKLTPTFTSGKMKYMLGTVLAVSDKLSNRFAQATAQPRIEIKDIWARYSTDVIGSCAFGIECNTLHAENTHFREIGRMFFEEPRHGLLFQNVLNQSKKLGNLLRIKQLPSHAAAFFMKIVKDTIRYREANTGARRKDFMSILIDLKNNPSIALTEEEIAAQALIFFLAGFETSSSLLSFCTYELAIHQDIQERARREVHEVLARHNGELTYEALSELPYCDQVLNGIYINS